MNRKNWKNYTIDLYLGKNLVCGGFSVEARNKKDVRKAIKVKINQTT